MAGHEATGEAGRRQDQQERTLVDKLPEPEDVPPDQERGEGIGTGKAVATGGGATSGESKPTPRDGGAQR